MNFVIEFDPLTVPGYKGILVRDDEDPGEEMQQVQNSG